MKQTVKAQRIRLRQLAYQINHHGTACLSYTVVAWSCDHPRVIDRAGSYGVVQVPWERPAYVR